MKSVLATSIIATLGLVGCVNKLKPVNSDSGATTTSTTMKAKPHDEPKWVSKLREKTEALGLAFSVQCDDQGGYIAWAHKPGDDWAKAYVEEGAEPYWVAEAETQHAAVVQLTELLSHDPNRLPPHKPRKKKAYCLPPLAGGPGVEAKYADQECPDCGDK